VHHHTTPSLAGAGLRGGSVAVNAGMEPTAKRRGLDSHRTTVEHNLRAGEEQFK
jgi:hypothetical protein